MNDQPSTIHDPRSTPYDVIIGLEVHVQLLTQSKLFCGCSTKFGAPPNTQTCPVCIGMPGVLPVMNRHAVELSLRAAAALNCQLARFTKWDRKNYYYPDLPKGYQISQFDLPLSHDGYLEISDPKGRIAPKRIGIIRAHLEEDAGKSMHDEQAGRADSRIDLNRTGTPLLEIVSQPDLRSPLEARLYLDELKLLLGYLQVSDCNMQEGSLRVDANVNLHVDTPQGRVATPIVEVKNVNSFRAVERAMTYEAQRQWQLWRETGRRLGEVPKTTRGWDDSRERTYEQRSKEESSDYRYFPDPDLVPVTVSEEEIVRVHQSLGELPAALRKRLEQTYGITPYDSDVLVNQGREVVEWYEKLANVCGDGKVASSWIQHLLRKLNEKKESQKQPSSFPFTPTGGCRITGEALVTVVRHVKDGTLPASRAREVFDKTVDNRTSVEEEIRLLDIQEVGDSDLDGLCRELIEANPRIVAEVRAGKVKAAGALIGQAKRKNPNVNPGRVHDRCLEMIRAM